MLEADGTQFEGAFSNLLLNGEGNYQIGGKPESSEKQDVVARYVGAFKAGKMDGYGKGTFSDGTQHAGLWKEGKGYGAGLRTYTSGYTLEGNRKDNAIHGKGTINYAGGATYTDSLLGHSRHGHGVYTHSDGRKWIGVFSHGRLGEGRWL